jgi:hypothetical protein
MAKRSGAKRDFLQVAREVVEQAIGERLDGSPLENPTPPKSSRAAAGSKGGSKGGKARAALLTPARRRDIARQAAQKRWKRKGD